MVLTKNHILAVVLCLAMLCVPMAILSEDSSADYEAKPAIADAGYIENQASFFYYAKFVDSAVTSSSISADTPALGVGETMYANSVFVKLNGLDDKATYNLTISEFSSTEAEAATASVKVTLELESFDAFVYFSVSQATPKLYNKGTQLTSAEFTGTFTSTTETQIFKIVLSDKDSKEIANQTVSDIAHYTNIAFADILDFNETFGDGDLIEIRGRAYGFVNTDPHYTAKKISADGYGKYVFAVYVTNVANPVIKVSNGGSYTVEAAYNHMNTDEDNNPLTSGMGIVAVSEDVLSAKDVKDIGNVKLTIGDASAEYASHQFSTDSGNNNLTVIIIAGAAIAIVAIVAIVVISKRKA